MDNFLQALPIVDAHHHFWELSGVRLYPWLMQPPWLNFRYGDYSAIRRNYLPDDYAKDTAKHNIVRTIHMEAEFSASDPIGETRWIATIREEFGRPDACVAQVWFDRPDIDEILAAQATFPFVRSTRHKPSALAASMGLRRGRKGSMDDPLWRRGYALLEPYGLRFDLQTPYWHLPEAADLARDFPATKIIINHTALPADRSESGLAAWRRNLEGVAAYPNVYLKISGIGLEGGLWPVSQNKHIVLDAIFIMGWERCMFASNFPVDGLCADFDTIFGAYKSYVAAFPCEQINALFHDNALRVYGLN
jgi:predicted TIM-barrel fold metal-dependent hydrolase